MRNDQVGDAVASTENNDGVDAATTDAATTDAAATDGVEGVDQDAATEGPDDHDDYYDLDPVYEARKIQAVEFVRALEALSEPKRRLLILAPEIETARFVMTHLHELGRLSAVGGRTIASQTQMIRRLSMVAGLWALHPAKDGKGTIGDSLARACRRDRTAGEAALRMATMATDPIELLDDPMRRIVLIHRRKRVPINWPRLLIDIDVWHSRPGEVDVRVRWLRDYFVRR